MLRFENIPVLTEVTNLTGSNFLMFFEYKPKRLFHLLYIQQINIASFEQGRKPNFDALFLVRADWN